LLIENRRAGADAFHSTIENQQSKIEGCLQAAPVTLGALMLETLSARAKPSGARGMENENAAPGP